MIFFSCLYIKNNVSMEFAFIDGFTFVDLEAARLVRKAYIDSLISSMVKLETDPHVVVWIDRLRLCRERDWDDEVRDIIRNAIANYNQRWIVVYGGKNGGGFGDWVGKFATKAVTGVQAAITGNKESVPPGSLADSVRKGIKGVGNVLGVRGGDSGDLFEDDLQSALRAELERMNEMESRFSN
jgi:hypothetical protein